MPVKRFRWMALSAVVSLASVLGGCRDYTTEIQAVQTTPMRDVAFSGETKINRLRLTLAEYIPDEFPFESLETSWSGANCRRARARRRSSR